MKNKKYRGYPSQTGTLTTLVLTVISVHGPQDHSLTGVRLRFKVLGVHESLRFGLEVMHDLRVAPRCLAWCCLFDFKRFEDAIIANLNLIPDLVTLL